MRWKRRYCKMTNPVFAALSPAKWQKRTTLHLIAICTGSADGAIKMRYRARGVISLSLVLPRINISGESSKRTPEAWLVTEQWKLETIQALSGRIDPSPPNYMWITLNYYYSNRDFVVGDCH